MNDLISPTYQMKLVSEIEKAIWDKYSSYKNVKFYIEKWHIPYETWNNQDENFPIINTLLGEFDLRATLHGVYGELLLKIAVDLGVNTPDFIPSVASFRNEIKSEYTTASATFEKAFKQIETHPDIAIGLANSALESIIKHIFQDDRIKTKPKSGRTLYDLTAELLKEFQLCPGPNMPLEIKTIGSSIMAINQSIEKLRSEKTLAHGKVSDDYIIEDSLYTYFIVNSVTTVGLFLNSFYKKKFPKHTEEVIDDGLPF
jgi:hypothetical protein